jgi:hypothetical protein
MNMSEHCGYIVKVNTLRPHPNADRLQIATFFGNDTCVGIDVILGEVGIYFPSDLQLSLEFAEVNNLLRKKDENGNNIGGFLDPDKRNITAIKLRGEKSDGLFLPLKSLESFGDITTLHEGDRIDNFNGHEICCKYVPRTQHRKGHYSDGNKTRKKKVPVAPLFSEHADTEQLAYNLGAFKPGDEIEITLKMHGTSQRTGYLPVLKGYKRTLIDKILRREGKPIYDWGYVSGTRRTVLENFEGGYYGNNEFRETHSKFFEGKLNKGEEIFYEVVGFTTNGTPIMGDANNKKLNDKEFIKKYGEITRFSYGCHPDGGPDIDAREDENGYLPRLPQSDIYVYRMTMTNEDGFVVEYTPDFMRYRCEQMGVKTVPMFWKGRFGHDCPCADDCTKKECNVGECIKRVAEQYYDGPDPIGKTHIREGVVVRIINRPKFCAYKHKNWYFKALEGIVKVEAEAPDMEEAESVENDTE